MRGLVRLLVMFGPMLFRQFEKYQRNKERKQQYNQGGRTPELEPRYSRSKRAETPPPPVVPKKKELSEEEKNFKLKEEEFMIDADVLDDYETPTAESPVTDIKATTDESIDDTQLKTAAAVEANQQSDQASAEDEAEGTNEEDDDLDLKDLFFDKED